MDADEPMVYMKIYEQRGERVVAICDEDLIDKKLIDSKLGIVFHVSREFYGGELVPLSMAIEEAKNATILNIVGEKIVSAAIRNDIIHPEAVIKIAGVPHAQAIRILW